MTDVSDFTLISMDIPPDNTILSEYEFSVGEPFEVSVNHPGQPLGLELYLTYNYTPY